MQEKKQMHQQKNVSLELYMQRQHNVSHRSSNCDRYVYLSAYVWSDKTTFYQIKQTKIVFDNFCDWFHKSRRDRELNSYLFILEKTKKNNFFLFSFIRYSLKNFLVFLQMKFGGYFDDEPGSAWYSQAETKRELVHF